MTTAIIAAELLVQPLVKEIATQDAKTLATMDVKQHVRMDVKVIAKQHVLVALAAVITRVMDVAE